MEGTQALESRLTEKVAMHPHVHVRARGGEARNEWDTKTGDMGLMRLLPG